MVVSIFNMINSALSSCSTWFLNIFNASGVVEVFLAMLFVVFSFKFLLQPVLGRSRGSDRAGSKRNKDDVNE